MAKITWREAIANAEKADRIKSSRNEAAADKLGKELSTIQIEDFSKSAPFYGSKMRIRAALADSTSKDLERVIYIAMEMLDSVTEEESRQADLVSAIARLRNEYKQDNLGFTSFKKYLEGINANKSAK